jgi:predicted dehydrogenase
MNMSDRIQKSRRSFIKKAIGGAIVTGIPSGMIAQPSTHLETLKPSKNFTANDQVNIAVIGMGIMGFDNMETSTKIPGVKLVAACDLYTGRLDHAKEVFGKDLFVTKDYKEILDRKDIDAVFVATSDHWHDRITIDALNKGKHVYCEKPMVHKLDEGAAVIATQKKTGKVVQIGSQRVSSIVTEKTKEIYESGVIGQLVLVETWMDRHSAMGAWQYSIPTDASKTTIDWERFLGDAPKVDFDPVRFFRWRNYQDYGTGIAGDLFVHLFSGLHTVLSSKGPNRIYATGGLRFWKDGRDVPDVITGLYDYPATDKHPAFTLQMRVNFVDGSHGDQGLRLIGSDGVINMGWDEVTVQINKTSKIPGYGGWDSFSTYTVAQQKEYEAWYKAKYKDVVEKEVKPVSGFKAPENYSANTDHHLNFYKGIRENAPIKEDALFGMRAGGPALASNKSLFEQKIVKWDPETATVLAGS